MTVRSGLVCLILRVPWAHVGEWAGQWPDGHLELNWLVLLRAQESSHCCAMTLAGSMVVARRKEPRREI